MAVVPGGRLREHCRAGENFRHERAPQSAGIWRIRLGSGSPINGHCLLVVLTWVGNNYFGHAAAALPRRPSKFNGCLAPLAHRGWRQRAPWLSRTCSTLGIRRWTCRNAQFHIPLVVSALAGPARQPSLNAFMEVPQLHGTLSSTQCPRGPCGTRWCWNSEAALSLGFSLNVCVQTCQKFVAFQKNLANLERWPEAVSCCCSGDRRT